MPYDAMRYSSSVRETLSLKVFQFWDNHAEQAQVEALGMTLLHSPLWSMPRLFDFFFPKPRDETINQVLSTMADPAAQPVFVHCLRGNDRTGLIVGLYRVLIENRPPAEACDEMLERGFHTRFYQLVRYFQKRTGYLCKNPKPSID